MVKKSRFYVHDGGRQGVCELTECVLYCEVLQLSLQITGFVNRGRKGGKPVQVVGDRQYVSLTPSHTSFQSKGVFSQDIHRYTTHLHLLTLTSYAYMLIFDGLYFI